jgi:hypothetical protein
VNLLLEAELNEKMDFARVLHRNYLKMVDFVKDVTKTAEGYVIKSAGVYAVSDGDLFLG